MTTHTEPLDPRALAYLRELAADIAAHGGFQDQPLDQVLQAAHTRRQGFAQEILHGRTPRAQMARESLSTSIWIQISQSHAIKTSLQRCEHLAKA